jgi:hypothetical protein
LRAVRARWRTGLGAAVLCALAAAVPAQAAFNRAPIQVGPSDGGSPSVVMDPAGTAHIVWGIAEELIGYCALPRGARQCAHTTQLALDAREGRPQILRRAQDGALVVIAGRDDIDDDPDQSTWAFTSADGVTWAGPTPIGLGIGASLDAAALTADGQAVDLLQSETGSNLFQRAPLAGPPSAAVLNLASTPAGTSTDYTYPGELERMRDGRTLALLGSPADGFAYRILSGADPFADASWQPWPAGIVSREWDEPRGATGPRGAYVMYGVHILDQVYGAAPQVVRRFRGTRWGRPRGLFYEVDANTDRAALAQDGKGRLHAAIVGYADSGRRECIAYARTSKRRWFTHAVSLHQTIKDADEPGRIRLAVDGKGRGVVAWATDGAPSVARVQRLKAGKGVTRPRPSSRRGCPPFAR